MERSVLKSNSLNNTKAKFFYFASWVCRVLANLGFAHTGLKGGILGTVSISAMRPVIGFKTSNQLESEILRVHGVD